MDVRCESCHTEYELDDGNVKDTGTEVQCTSCGHTFTVYPTGTTPPGTAAGATTGTRPSLASAEFLLETADGRTHRLRDLTMLQKWIIERRVTRADRISRHGQPWARLGTLDDLAPFFDVVDEADRARAAVGRAPGVGADLSAGAAGRTGSASAAFGSPFGVSGGAAHGRTVGASSSGAGVGLTGATGAAGGSSLARGHTPESQRAVNRSLEMLAVEAPVPTEEPDTSIVMRPGGRPWWKLLITFGVAGGVFYFGIRALPSLMVKGQKLGAAGHGAGAGQIVPATDVGSFSRSSRSAADEAAGSIPAGEGAAAPGAGVPALPGAPEGSASSPPAATGTGTAEATAPTAPVAEAPGGTGAPGTTPTPAAPTPAGPEVVPLPTPAPGRPATPPAPEGSTVADSAPAPSAPARANKPARTRARIAQVTPADDLPYDRLVAQADRLLENGANERALRLYERALALRPDAPEALTGIGYVHLDRNRNGAAIEFFTRASAASPYAPALFGLGQAYRAAGDPGRARQTYQRYLALYPTGSDAPAAERQLQSLAQQPANAGEAPANILHEGGTEPRPAEPK
jgi:predicted Zn finger-like uncharacterized protein